MTELKTNIPVIAIHLYEPNLPLKIKDFQVGLQQITQLYSLYLEELITQ